MARGEVPMVTGLEPGSYPRPAGLNSCAVSMLRDGRQEIKGRLGTSVQKQPGVGRVCKH